MSDLSSAIAVVGLVGRFPGAADTEALWSNLTNGVESITTLDDEALIAAGVPEGLRTDPSYVRRVAAIEGVDRFDAAFFGLSPREAELMDPQYRLFLEACWSALEDAGCDPERFQGNIGLYAGATINTYLLNNLWPNRALMASVDPMQIIVGNERDALTTRVAYKLNLRGPCYTVQTFCSTSLVAIHIACQALLGFEADMALAGGVSIRVPQAGYLHQSGGLMSSDGSCRAFDARGEGSVFGDGLGVVVLKRAEDAVADRDHIRAIIRGSAINNDGALKVSYTAPSVTGQAQVIREALTNAGVSPDEIDYVEAHGTATPLGDPIELAALNKAFRGGAAQRGRCALGSVKTNFGHLDRAAGVVGFIKTVLALEHRQIPPTLHFQTPNPELDLASSPFFVNTELTPWPDHGRPRRAGVSSFGIGGTNAHVVIEEAPEVPPSGASKAHQLLVLSAKSDSALEQMTDHLAEALPARPLPDAAFTLATGRRIFDHRRAIVATDAGAAARALGERDPRTVLTSRTTKQDRGVAFMFPGLGDHYVGMGQDLYAEEPVYRAAVDRGAELLQAQLGLDLRAVLHGPRAQGAPGLDLLKMLGRAPVEVDERTTQLQTTALAHPAIFIVELALVELWRSLGVEPTAMIGYSLGELAAACVAGVFSFEDGLALVAKRARMIQELPRGAMLAVQLDADALAPTLGPGVWISAINGPQMTVVSGAAPQLEALGAALVQRSVVSRRIQSGHAFHCPLIDPIVDALVPFVRGVKLSPPKIPIVSNVTGTWLTDAQATDPEYWARHTSRPVLFSAGLDTLWSDGRSALLEVGPGFGLGGLALQHPRATEIEDRLVLASLRHGYETQHDRATFLDAAARLWLGGAGIDLAALWSNEARARVRLPTYPFEKSRYWVDAPGAAVDASLDSRLESRKLAAKDWFSSPGWRRAPLRAEARHLDGSTWIVGGDAVLSMELAESIRGSGSRVTLVVSGEGGMLSGDRAEVDPTSVPALAKLIDAAGLPQRILHLMGTEPSQDPRVGAEAILSVAALVQAVLSRDPAAELDLTLVTRGVEDVTGAEPLSPGHAPLRAAAKVVAQEHPAIRCRAVDLDATGPDSTAMLLAELGGTDREVALRNGLRWVPTFNRIELAESGALVAPGTVVLMTGAFGRVGLVVAKALAQCRCRLILTSRGGGSLEAVAELEALGAEVLAVAADVTDRAAMAAAVAEGKARFGGIQVLLHAAGTTAQDTFRAVQEVERSDLEVHFGPKARGLVLLSELLADHPLERAMVFSSASVVLGGLGFLTYSGANAFMDAFVAAERRRKGVAWTAVDWSDWQTSAGALAGTEMSAEEGARAFARAFAAPEHARLVHSTIDLEARLSRWISGAPAEVGSFSASHERPQLSTPYVAPSNDTETRIAEIWQSLLGIDGIGIHDRFLALGGNSLLGTQLVAHLRAAFAVNLPLRSLFTAQTIAELAVLIEEAVLAEIEGLPEHEGGKSK